MNQRDTQKKNDLIAHAKCTTAQRQVLMGLSSLAAVEETMRVFGIAQPQNLPAAVDAFVDGKMGLEPAAASDFKWEGSDRVFPSTLSKEAAEKTLKRNAGRVSR